MLATGSSPRSLPRLEFDGTRVLSSDHVLELDEVPPRVAIIGGGAIGCEFASFLADIGSEVTLLEALPRILPGRQRTPARSCASFKKRGIKVHTRRASPASRDRSELTVTWETDAGEQSVVVDKVVVSVGRRPADGGIGLEGSGVEVDERGFVVVDGQMRTTVAGVYAVGDLVATPAARARRLRRGDRLVKTILGEPATPVDYDKVPWGIYCHPEVAFCGLTEEQAREHGHDVVTSVHRFAGNEPRR